MGTAFICCTIRPFRVYPPIPLFDLRSRVLILLACAQMADMLRTQNLARNPGQQQQLGQQFGLAGQMSTQQSPFHDPSAQRPQSHISANFPNMGIPNIQQSINARNPMLQPYNGNNAGQMTRLDLMGLAQNQQSQAGSLNFAARIGQQPQHQTVMNPQTSQNQSTQSDLFTSPGMTPSDGIRRSPSHLAQPPPSIGNIQLGNPQNSHAPPAGRRHMTFPELRERAQQLQTSVLQRERALELLVNNRGGTSDAELMHKVQAGQTEIKREREMLAKVIQAMSQAASQQNLSSKSAVNGGSMYVNNHTPLSRPLTESRRDGSSSQSQQPSAPSQGGQTQQQWMPRSDSSQPQGFGNVQIGQTTPHGQTPYHSLQRSPLQMHPQPSHPNQQSMIPPRAGPTPQQMIHSPNVGNQYPFSMTSHGINPQPQAQFMPALDKTRFDTAYNNFCLSKGVQHDPRLMSVDGRPIDLHELHVQVMNEGGVTKVRASFFPTMAQGDQSIAPG
jgi:hypothetical protein